MAEVADFWKQGRAGFCFYFGKENVARFDVPMNDTVIMDEGKRFAKTPKNRQRQIERNMRGRAEK
jgi:hypothetical protein